MPITHKREPGFVRRYPYQHLKEQIEKGSRRRIRNLPEFLSPHRCWKEAPKVSTTSATVVTFWRGREWYQSHLRRSQRNVGAVLALELAIEAAAIYTSGDRQWHFLQYTREYAAAMRHACSARPSVVCRAHRHWIATVDLAIPHEPISFPDYSDDTNLGHLYRVLRWCRQFFHSHTGNAYEYGWQAMHEWCSLAVQADLVDSRSEAFALWWHTLRCRLAFHDSSHCVFV